MTNDNSTIKEAIKEFGAGRVDAFLNFAIQKGANVLPQPLYDHERFLAAGPGQQIVFFASQQGQGVGAFAAGAKSLTDTNMTQGSKLASDTAYIGLGIAKSYPPRWLAYGATQADRQNDYINRTKDIEQLEGAMGAVATLRYQGTYEFLTLPVYQIPSWNYPATFGSLVMNSDNFYRFDRIAAFELEKEASFAVQEQFTAPAAFGSTVFLVQGFFIMGYMIKGLGALGSDFRKMLEGYQKGMK